MAKQGKLPSRADRLPENPVVVQPVERIGVYGGTWRTALVGGEDQPRLQRTINWEGIVRHNPEFDDVYPNVAESLEINDDATEFVFSAAARHEVVGRRAVRRRRHHVLVCGLLHKRGADPVKDTMFVAGGEPLDVTKVDDHTVSFTFAATNGLYEQYLGGGRGDEPVKLPRHYLEQFNRDHNPDGIDALVEESGHDDWVQLFLDRADWSINPDIPTLHAWNLTAGYEGTGNRLIATRNPYCWKAAPDGNQLPYIDEVVFSVIENNETVLLNPLNGELDMRSRHINTAESKPVLSQSREQGRRLLRPGPRHHERRARRQMAQYDELRATADAAGREELMKEILEIAADQFYAIGIAFPANAYRIVRNSFHNVPGQMFTSTGATYPEPTPTNPGQYFVEGQPAAALRLLVTDQRREAST